MWQEAPQAPGHGLTVSIIEMSQIRRYCEVKALCQSMHEN